MNLPGSADVEDAGPVERWFGPRFAALHPTLQHLHRGGGGRLEGTVDVTVPTGLAGVIGRRLAQRLGVPIDTPRHAFTVDISHQADGLHWDRRFDGRTDMRSVFEPIGTWPEGWWLERTGPVQLRLTVDVIDGGWHWRCQRISWRGVRLPMGLFPKSRAYKRIDEEGRYRFEVSFSMPLVGTVLGYGGTLWAAPRLG